MDNLHESQETLHTDSVTQQESRENMQNPSNLEVEDVQSPEILNQEQPAQEQELPKEEAAVEKPVRKQRVPKKEAVVEEATIEEPVQEEKLPEEEVAVEKPVKRQRLPKKEAVVEEPVQEEKQVQVKETAPQTEQTPSAEEERMKIADDFYDHLNKQEVVETLEKVVAESDIVKIKTHVSLLKIRFLQLNKEDKEQRHQTFIAEGGNKEDYTYESDEWEVRFNKAFETYKANKLRYAEELEQTKLANLTQKTALLEELKVLVDSTESLKQIYDRFKEIQNTWKEIGVVPQANVGELWQNYHFYVEKFFDKIRINRELRDLDFKKNLEIKLDICEKTEALLLETSVVKAFNLLQEYRQEWKESGSVEEDKREELWNRFKTASDKIYQNHIEYREQYRKQREENYKAKLALCENMEKTTNVKLVSASQINAISAAVTELFKTWQTLGPAPREVHNEVWERFRKDMDDFTSAKKQYFAQLLEKQVNNYNLKVNMCMQAEAIALRKDWKRATEELFALQEDWKKIGPIPIKQSEAVWHRFRKACDNFFTAKKEYTNNIKHHRADNLKKKEDLIKRVTEFQFGDSRDDNFTVLKEFQREWTDIGYTEHIDKDRLWSAFRAAIDAKFDELKSFMNMEDKTKYAQRVSEILKNETVTAGKFLVRERAALQEKIRQLTDEVNLWENNLGFFANSKNSEALREQFGKKIDAAKQEIASLKEKLGVVKEKKEGQGTGKK